MSHPAKVYTSLEQLIAETVVRTYDKYVVDAIRHARRRWKNHIEKNGEVPLIVQCPHCSGKQAKQDVKTDRYLSARDLRDRSFKRADRREARIEV
jgi:N-formylglutamate amidohydrolase